MRGVRLVIVLVLGALALTVALAAGQNPLAAAQSTNTGAARSGIVLDAPVNRPNRQPSRILPEDFLGLVLDDGYAEEATGFGDSINDISYAGIWLNRYTLGPQLSYPIRFSYIQILFPGPDAGNLVGKQIRLVMYFDQDGNNDPSNAALVYQSIQTITVADWSTFQTFPIDYTLPRSGDLYVGWEDLWAESGPSPLIYVAAKDNTAPQRRSWFAGNRYSYTPNISNLGANYYLGLEDDFTTPGNYMVRAIGDTFTPATPTPAPTNTPTSTPTPVPPRCPGERFTDVCPGDYFYQPVLYLNDRAIINGYNTVPPCENAQHIPCFKPYNNSTRAQIAKIVSLAAGFVEPVSGQSFEDVPPTDTFYVYIERMVQRGIISGYPCSGPGEPCIPPLNRAYFRPGNTVTRGQLSKMIVGAFNYTEPTAGQIFEDVPPGSTFYDFIQRLAARDIINGYPCASGPSEPCVPPGNRPYFRPNNSVTRGQTSKIVYLAMTQPSPTPTATATHTRTPTAMPTLTSTATSIATEVPTGTPTGVATATATAEASPTSTTTVLPRR
jgi:hypothetical protein